jgi:hypothetical protein
MFVFDTVPQSLLTRSQLPLAWRNRFDCDLRWDRVEGARPKAVLEHDDDVYTVCNFELSIRRWKSWSGPGARHGSSRRRRKVQSDVVACTALEFGSHFGSTFRRHVFADDLED